MAITHRYCTLDRSSSSSLRPSMTLFPVPMTKGEEVEGRGVRGVVTRMPTLTICLAVDKSVVVRTCMRHRLRLCRPR